MEKVTHQEQIESALEDKELPTMYFNSFITSVGTGDVLIVLRQRDKPVAVLNTSYTVAKTLAEKLGGVLAVFEQKTGNTIMTSEHIGARLAEGVDHDGDE